MVREIKTESPKVHFCKRFNRTSMLGKKGYTYSCYSPCGLFTILHSTNNWSKVTCKNCLRVRK